MGQLADEVWRLIERRLSFKNEEAREIANYAWYDHAAPLLDELESRQRFMASRGYQPCDIPACNCNSWHGGLAEERLREWGELLGSRTQGETLLSATSKILEELEAAREAMGSADWMANCELCISSYDPDSIVSNNLQHELGVLHDAAQEYRAARAKMNKEKES